MNHIALITLILGALGGYLIGSHSPEEKHVEEHVHHKAGHVHELRNIEGVAPSVDLVLHEDPRGGYIAQVLVENFTFAPENVSTDDVPGEGHAHIYVNGEKVNRILGEWYNLGELPEGHNDVSVRLSSNDHFELAVNDEPIEDIEAVDVGEVGEHDHDH